MPEETWEPSPGTTYNDLIKVILDLRVNGTVTGATFSDPDTGYTYTVSGEIKTTANINVNVDAVIGQTTSSIDMDCPTPRRTEPPLPSDEAMGWGRNS
jgi:uncharacterized protein (DUF2147 family)